MRLTRSMTKLYNNITLENNKTNSSNNKRLSSQKSPQHEEVVLTNHAAKRVRTQQHEEQQFDDPLPAISDHNTPTSYPSSPVCNQVLHTSTPPPQSIDHEDRHPFENNLSPSHGNDEPSRIQSQGTLTPITNDSQERHYSNSISPTNIYYDEQENSVHSYSPARSPPALAIANRSDILRYSDPNDDDLHDNTNNDDNDDDAHYSAFGWPSMDPPGDDDIASSFNNDSSRRGGGGSSYLNDNDDNNSSASFFSDRPLQRSLLQDFLQVDDYNNSSHFVNNDSDDEGTMPMMTAQQHQPTDEVDLFFSASHADYASMSFSTKLSIQQQKQQFLALGRPTYITSWPHFLTLEYFDNRDAHDRSDIVPSPSSSDSNNIEGDQEDMPGGEISTPLSSASYFDTKFSVLERIGSGEYADVWKVWNTESNEVFAVKKLKIPFQSFADRWLQLVEVRNMMMVQHSPFCLNLFNAWEQDGYLYLQTDFAVATLADYLQQEQESISEPMAWKIIYEMSMGLQAIHHAGLVHLDLKPSNVMIDPNGSLKIGDFGTSIRRPLDVYEFKGEGDRHYMAPDLLREEYDTPADVFSLGLIIFEMMTQVQLPSTGDSWEMLRLGDFSNYKQRLGDVPLEIRRVMLMMLKSSSDDRATMDDILALPHLQRIAAATTTATTTESEADVIEQQPGALYDYAQLLQDDQE